MAYIWDYFSAGRIDAVGDNINDMAPIASIRPAKKEPESKSLAFCKHPLSRILAILIKITFNSVHKSYGKISRNPPNHISGIGPYAIRYFST